jgi:hypothetical protein
MVSAKPKLTLTVALGRTEHGRLINVEAAVTEEFGWQAWVFAALAFIYGLAIMTVVIVALAKSARVTHPKEDRADKIKIVGIPR